MVRKLGIPPENLDPLRYSGPRFNLTPVTEATRRPTTLDRDYSLFTFWRTQTPTTDGSNEGEIWYLSRFSSGDAIWLMLATGAAGAVTQLRADDGNIALPNGLGIIDVDGVIVANATNATPLFTDGATANTVRWELQVATARTGAPANSNDAGICSFDDTAFVVDANGYVSLAGGAGPAIDSVDVDFNTAPGTDPVVPSGAGLISIFGNTVTNATNLNAPVATHSRAANQFHVDVQLSADITGAPADPFDAGLCSFNDTQFVVDANGYVSLVGGANLPSIETVTGDDATAVGPDASGNINFNGTAVANATNAKPLYFNGTPGSNLQEAEIQVSTAIAAAPGDKNDAGIASFDSSQFTVDTDGFVQMVGSGPINPLSTIIEYDEFLNTRGSVSSEACKLGWQPSGAVNWNVAGSEEAGHPGIVRVGSNSVATAYISLDWGTRYPVILGGGEITITWVSKVNALSDGTNTYIFYMGIGNPATLTEGCYFKYTHSLNSGNWQIITSSGGTATTNNSSTALDTNWHRYEIVINAGATSVAFFIDGVEVANSPNTTNIPTASIAPFMLVNKTAGAGNNYALADLFIYEQVFTTPR